MRPVINGPRDIRPGGFLCRGAFHARHLLDSPLFTPHTIRRAIEQGATGESSVAYFEWTRHRDESTSNGDRGAGELSFVSYGDIFVIEER